MQSSNFASKLWASTITEKTTQSTIYICMLPNYHECKEHACFQITMNAKSMHIDVHGLAIIVKDGSYP